MKIAVVGAGYVGLTTAACLARIGHRVFCSDNDVEKLTKLQHGLVPIFEPFLQQIIGPARQSGQLIFGETEQAIDWGEAIFLCVGTPPLPNGDADLSAIDSVAQTIAKRASGYRLVIEKSTVPVQTGSQLRKHLSAYRSGTLDCDIASNPEFLREGSAVEDFLHPDRIVIGVDSVHAADLLREIYQPITTGSFPCPVHSACPTRIGIPFLVTDMNSAELIKHASNSFLAMKISFINMVADLCEALGADIIEVSRGMGMDPRIGPAFLQAGIGFGGFCFPKDLQALIRIAEKSGCNFSLLKVVQEVNQRRIEHIVGKLRDELWVLRGKKIAVLGLAFKPNTDDVRFAPSIAIIRILLEEGAMVSAYDPGANETARAVLPHISYSPNPYAAATSADAILIATEWDEFRHLDWKRIRQVVSRPLIVDGRNMIRAEDVTSHGFLYVSIGRRSVVPPPAEPRVAEAEPQTSTINTAEQVALSAL